MILLRNKLGNRAESGLIRHVGTWDNIWKTSSPIRFLPTYTANIVDICWGENGTDLEVWVYPHNQSGIGEMIHNREKELMELLSELSDKNPGKTMFTVNVGSVNEIVLEDFSTFNPPSSHNYIMFIFETTEADVGFPAIFCIEKHAENGTYALFLHVQAVCSHSVMKPASKPTNFGKSLSYILAASSCLDTFCGDDFPSIQSIDLCNSGKEEFPSFLDNSGLELFASKCELHKVVRVDGKFVDKSSEIEPLGEPSEELNSPTALVHLPEITQDLVYSSEITQDMDSKVEQFREKIHQANRIQESIINKGFVNLSDLLGFGVRDTFMNIPSIDDGQIITVSLDIGGMFKRMCMKDGKVYFVLLNPKDDWETYLGSEQDLFVSCTDETYPVNYNH